MIRQLLQYAKQARRIELDQERIAFFIYQAIEVQYTQAQFERAKLWIMNGDWKFRGTDPVLQWDDLFPSDEQIKEAHARSNSKLVLIDPKTLQFELMKAHKAGLEEGKSIGMVKMDNQQFESIKKVLEQWTV